MGVNWAEGDGWAVVCNHTLVWLDPAWSPEDAMACWHHGIQDDFWGLSSRLAGKATGGYALLGFGVVQAADRDLAQGKLESTDSWLVRDHVQARRLVGRHAAYAQSDLAPPADPAHPHRVTRETGNAWIHLKGRLTVVAAGVVVVARSNVDELLVRGSVDAPSQGELASVVDVQVGSAQVSVFPTAGGVLKCGGLHWTCDPPGPGAGPETVIFQPPPGPDQHPVGDPKLPGSVSHVGGVAKPVDPSTPVRPRSNKPVVTPPAPKPAPAPQPPPPPSQPEPVAPPDNPFTNVWDHTGTDSVESAAVRHVGGDSDQAPVPKPPPPSKPAEHPSPGEPADKPGGGAGVTLPEPPPVRVRGNAGLPVDSTLVIETDEDEAPQGFGKAVVGGEEVDIHDTVVIGRAPSPIPGEQCTLLRASHERSISRSHVLLRVVGDEVVAIDLGSNNGTKLLRPGQPDQMVTTTPVLVHDGDTLDLGESVHVRLVGLP